MKIYYVSAAIIAVLSALLSVYFYLQLKDISQHCAIYKEENGRLTQERETIKKQMDKLENDKMLLEGSLSEVRNQADKAKESVAVLSAVLNSFMYAGDIKAQTVGLKETEAVEGAIASLSDSVSRMSAEKNWADFKKSLYFNPLFGLLRGLSRDILQDLGRIGEQNGPSQNAPQK
jgi:uncharacterized protein YoxC